jgi:hypothetical protein
MSDLYGPSVIEGKADSQVEFKNISSGQLTLAVPDPSGKFRIMLPEGKYITKSNGMEQNATFLPSEIYNLDLQQKSSMSFEVSKTVSGKNDVTIKVTAQGNGSHQLTIRADNLAIKKPLTKMDLKPGGKKSFSWKCRIISPDESWVAVIVPDNEISGRKEILGTMEKK